MQNSRANSRTSTYIPPPPTTHTGTTHTPAGRRGTTNPLPTPRPKGGAHSEANQQPTGKCGATNIPTNQSTNLSTNPHQNDEGISTNLSPVPSLESISNHTPEEDTTMISDAMTQPQVHTGMRPFWITPHLHTLGGTTGKLGVLARSVLGQSHATHYRATTENLVAKYLRWYYEGGPAVRGTPKWEEGTALHSEFISLLEDITMESTAAPATPSPNPPDSVASTTPPSESTCDSGGTPGSATTSATKEAHGMSQSTDTPAEHIRRIYTRAQEAPIESIYQFLVTDRRVWKEGRGRALPLIGRHPDHPVVQSIARDLARMSLLPRGRASSRDWASWFSTVESVEAALPVPIPLSRRVGDWFRRTAPVVRMRLLNGVTGTLDATSDVGAAILEQSGKDMGKYMTTALDTGAHLRDDYMRNYSRRHGSKSRRKLVAKYHDTRLARTQYRLTYQDAMESVVDATNRAAVSTMAEDAVPEV